jgi:hypothetical protein
MHYSVVMMMMMMVMMIKWCRCGLVSYHGTSLGVGGPGPGTGALDLVLARWTCAWSQCAAAPRLLTYMSC